MGNPIKLNIQIDQTGNAQDGIDGLIKSVGGGIQTAAGLAVGALGLVTGAVVGIGAAAVSAWSAMDEGVDNFTNKTGVTGEALGAVQQSIENISESSAGVGQSLGTIGDVMGTLQSRTDVTRQTLDEMTSGLLKLSRVTGEDAVQSSELFTRALGDWGVNASDSTELLDKLTVAHQKTGISVNDLMAKMVQFGAPMRQMGFSIDDSIALFSKWEKEGVNAELVMGSLRIAAGKFAKAEDTVTTKVKGGVKSLKESEEKLAKLKKQLELATIKQGEFTDKTKESTRVQSQMRIDDLTKDIYELETAMAKGEDTTITTVAAQKSLRDNLMDTFAAIKGATSETDALAIAMETFGAKAGPDMAAAIREGRFSIDDLVAALGDSEGALDKTAEATLDFGDRFGIMKQKILNSLIPVGQMVMDLGDIGLQFAGPMVDNLTGWIDKVTAKYQEGGIAGVTEMVKADLALLGNSINTQVQIYSQEFWAWLDDAVAKAPANFALLQNTIKTEIAFAWPGIQATLSEWGPKFWNWTLSAIVGTNTSMANLTVAINNWITAHQADIKGFGVTVGGYVYEGLTGAFSDTKKSDGAVQALGQSLATSIINIYSSIVTAGVNLGEGVLTGIIQQWSGKKASARLTVAIKGEMIAAVTAFSPLAIFTPVGRSMIDGMIKGLKNGWGAIERAARDAAKRAYDAAMGWLKAGSPSELFSDEVGETAIGGGIAQGIGRAAGAIKTSTQAALSPAAMVAGGGLSPAMAATGAGGAPIIVEFHYSPVVSTADKLEAQTVLAPMIADGVRNALAGRR